MDNDQHSGNGFNKAMPDPDLTKGRTITPLVPNTPAAPPVQVTPPPTPPSDGKKQ
jgi:hypothetical protein